MAFCDITHGWPVVTITVQPDSTYRDAAEIKLVHRIKDWLLLIQAVDKSQRENIITKEIHDSMTRAIFGSNKIERAGLDFGLTRHFCQEVFSGGIPWGIDSLSDDQLLEMCAKQPDLIGKSARHVQQSRNEVVQHARAFQHILHVFLSQERRLCETEEIIKETHRILVKGVPLVEEGFQDISPQDYGGIYRQVIVGAGTTNFTVPKFIPLQMKKMCQALERDLIEAERKGVIDPFSMAAKYSLEFVQIHPFRDGNGRMCRMILNAIICRYIGVIIPIGEREEDREAYMAIKKQASQDMEGHGGYASFVLQKSKTRVREMKKKLTGKRYQGPEAQSSEK